MAYRVGNEGWAEELTDEILRNDLTGNDSSEAGNDDE